MAYIGTAYLMGYFFLIGFVGIILSTSNVQVTTCSQIVVYWFKGSVAFYFVAFAISAASIMMIKKHGLHVEIVNLGFIEFAMQVYRRNWIFILLCVLDMCHLAITIWGTNLFEERF